MYSANVSMVDLTINTNVETTLPEILRALRHASETSLSGVLSVIDDEVVSCDLLGHSSSAIIDGKASVELNSKVCLSQSIPSSYMTDTCGSSSKSLLGMTTSGLTPAGFWTCSQSCLPLMQTTCYSRLEKCPAECRC